MTKIWLFRPLKLILSRNLINSSLQSDSVGVFDSLQNLKFLNLSSNSLEYVSSYLFNQLRKLETLDLSYNRIQLLEPYAFYKLSNLKNLRLNDNANGIQIHNESFIQLDQIQNIHLSKTILNDETNGIVFDLFKYKNSLVSKVVLKRQLYKSLFLFSSYEQYDCNLTLFFSANNIHYNFKTEIEMYDYFSECSQIKIKNSAQNSIISIDRDSRIFSNIFFYMFYLTLMFIIFMGLACFFIVKQKIVIEDKIVLFKKTKIFKPNILRGVIHTIRIPKIDTKVKVVP